MAITASIKRGAVELKLPETTIQRVLNWFFQEEVPYSLFVEGETLHFRNCGTFRTVYQAKVQGRNFQTDEPMDLAPRYRIVWKSRKHYKRTALEIQELKDRTNL